jgi:ferric-dicitrate binding protein FerR (iron transport regulator)
MAELEQLLLDHPDYWLKAGLTEKLSYKALPLLSDQEAARLADGIEARIAREAAEEETEAMPPPGRRRWFKTPAAGILLAAMLCGILFLAVYQFRQHSAASWQEVVAAPGARKNVLLADGTTIRLNAGSTLRYAGDDNPGHKTREVFLEGEAYFDVKPDAGKPFIIHGGKMEIKVLGTELNVRAYPDEEFSETALVNGAVEVTVQEKGNARKFRLKPGQKVVAKREEALPQNTTAANTAPPETVTLQPVSKATDNVIAETAWKEDKLVFQDETFAALALRLERWYGVNITIEDPVLASKRFSGRADNLPLPQLLGILQTITPFGYSINGQDVIIR